MWCKCVLYHIYNSVQTAMISSLRSEIEIGVCSAWRRIGLQSSRSNGRRIEGKETKIQSKIYFNAIIIRTQNKVKQVGESATLLYIWFKYMNYTAASVCMLIQQKTCGVMSTHNRTQILHRPYRVRVMYSTACITATYRTNSDSNEIKCAWIFYAQQSKCKQQSFPIHIHAQ